VPRPHPRLDALTDREREIVGLVGEGLSNEEIAERLVVSPATARTHVSRAMVKLGPRRSSAGLRVVCAPIAPLGAVEPLWGQPEHTIPPAARRMT
jgi:DNA-binding NarL/FixJ family response regulator